MQKIRGRGYSNNPSGRFAQTFTELDEGSIQQYGSAHESKIVLTELSQPKAKSILSSNHSPDIPFERSLNLYRGCEHGCVYCFARPTHSYLDLSPGLDFEQKLFFKSNAPKLLRKEFTKSNYQVKTISLGNITDTYQPIEKQLGLTREILNLMVEFKHPVSLVTKASLIERDIDLLEELAEQNLVHVAITITTLDKRLVQLLEPRATTAARRLITIKRLAEVGIPVSVLVAPIIPVLTDSEIENILSASQEAGCLGANFVMLRLPYEMKVLFVDWLREKFPLKAEHILNRLKEMHDGELYQSNFGKRMRGSGEYAKMIEERFRIACKKFGISNEIHALDESKFSRQCAHTKQIEMF
ncbi:MAG: PA0069 family radical SAM protein [Gammaproteobacteria bacterium]